MGGAEMLLKNTLPLLEEYKHIVCYLGGTEELKESFAAFPVYNLHHHKHLDVLRSIRRLRKIIVDNNAAIVHAHLFESTLIARLACPAKVKFIFTIHNLLSKDAFEVNRFSLWVEKFTYKKRHTIIGVSAGVIKDYDKYIGVKGAAYVVYNYIEDKYFENGYMIRDQLEQSFRLVAVGNLRRQKNYENLLKAFELLRDYPVTLDIYGKGDLQAFLQEVINKNKLSVTLKGRIQNVADVLPLYDAYIMPSLFEGYGIAPMEAMAAGMPVLLSDIEVFKELAGKSPVYFKPDDPESIAEAVKNMYKNWSEIKKRSEDNSAMVFDKASKQVYKTKLLDVYRQILTLT